LEPANAEALYLLGQVLNQLGQREAAVDAWQKAVEANPQHTEALYNLSRAFGSSNPEKASDYRGKFTALQQARQITDRAETLGNFAISAAAARDWPRAIAQLKEALDLCGECRSKADLHKNLGLVYCRSGDVKNGQQELQRAQQLKPSDPEIGRSLEILASLRP
jgi:tetratricopeptide (TPR) repeat protein